MGLILSDETTSPVTNLFFPNLIKDTSSIVSYIEYMYGNCSTDGYFGSAGGYLFNIQRLLTYGHSSV